MIRMTSVALGAAASLLALQPAFAEPPADVRTRCFQFSGQPAKLMQLRLIDTEDGNKAAFVCYAGSKTWIPLVLSRSQVMPMADSGRSQIDEEWVEVVHGQVGGRYLLSTQGNEVNSFEYVDRKNGNKTEFALAPMPRGVDPCQVK